MLISHANDIHNNAAEVEEMEAQLFKAKDLIRAQQNTVLHVIKHLELKPPVVIIQNGLCMKFDADGSIIVEHATL